MMACVAITGAAGFIGRHCVAQARRQDMHVIAFVRRLESALPSWRADPNITLVALDLATQTDTLAEALIGVDALIHCAATLSGDQRRDTLEVSAHVIAASVSAKVPHLVLAGSLDVYDVRTLPDHGVLTEACPLGTQGRTAYAKAKQAQEDLFEDAAKTHGVAVSILRLGAVWGPGCAFNAHVGPAFRTLLVMIDGGGVVPLCRVERAAAILLWAAQNRAGIEKINVVDDDLPDRRRFIRALRAGGWPKRVVRTPLWLWRAIATLSPNSEKIPGLLRRAVLETRHRPLTYDNARMHKVLGAPKSVSFETAMAADFARQIDQTETP
ncbi:NAD-dependent epimerase/dehydratase family protein [Shimia sp. MMG029]|uniref:NAD-dependent epimerase/dehydratase family protein n=1 Tax=Shimia sp. MMG029 TaxID=3021978 RepID=UPI0022FEDC33|nr:NAD(P)-dependent oxidoreductase [Shimia sp. MMG029]MDA5558609.1 NAD(P)-dependent oxidoreductase [Shimia sp. MMG029]